MGRARLEVARYAMKFEFLKRRASNVVAACNTASRSRFLRTQIVGVDVLGVIEPGAREPFIVGREIIGVTPRNPPSKAAYSKHCTARRLGKVVDPPAALRFAGREAVGTDITSIAANISKRQRSDVYARARLYSLPYTAPRHKETSRTRGLKIGRGSGRDALPCSGQNLAALSVRMNARGSAGCATTSTNLCARCGGAFQPRGESLGIAPSFWRPLRLGTRDFARTDGAPQTNAYVLITPDYSLRPML